MHCAVLVLLFYYMCSHLLLVKDLKGGPLPLGCTHNKVIVNIEQTSHVVAAFNLELHHM